MVMNVWNDSELTPEEVWMTNSPTENQQGCLTKQINETLIETLILTNCSLLNQTFNNFTQLNGTQFNATQFNCTLFNDTDLNVTQNFNNSWDEVICCNQIFNNFSNLNGTQFNATQFNCTLNSTQCNATQFNGTSFNDTHFNVTQNYTNYWDEVNYYTYMKHTLIDNFWHLVKKVCRRGLAV